MQMPNSYNETKAGGDYTPITLGGHHLVIKKVFEIDPDGNQIRNKNGEPMIIVCFDMANDDVQPKYATNEFTSNRERYNKFPFWPHSCTSYITTENDGKCTRQFKTFTTCFAHSNGLDENAIRWGSDFCNQFTGKKIGGVFGEVESEYNGNRNMKHELRWFCTDSKVDFVTVPEAKRLNGSSDNGFMSIPDGPDAFVPFG